MGSIREGRHGDGDPNYTVRCQRGRVLTRGATDQGRCCLAADADSGNGFGGRVAHRCRQGGWDGPSNIPRLGASVQRTETHWLAQQDGQRWAQAFAVAGAGSRSRRVGPPRTRPSRAPRDTLAPGRPCAGNRDEVLRLVLAERSTSDVLRRKGFRLLMARPRHRHHDAAAPASFKATAPSS